MTKRRFGKRLALAAVMVALATPTVSAQQAEPAPKPGKLIRVGEVLSGELNAMRARRGHKGKQGDTFQIKSAPRSLPPPAGLCNLETGPETFQLITTNDVQVAELKAHVGKEIAVKVGEIVCANDPGQVSEAVITKWSLMKK